MTRKITCSLALLGLALIASVPASADIIDLSLVTPPTLAVPGTVLSFSATVSAPSANGAPVFLNSDSANLDFPLVLDDTPFADNFPLSLSPGASFTGVLFTVTVPSDIALFDLYDGYFEIDGGRDGSASNFLGSVNFQVEAVPASTAPEPGNLVLPLLGLASMAAMLRRKRYSVLNS